MAMIEVGGAEAGCRESVELSSLLCGGAAAAVLVCCLCVACVSCV